MRSLELRRYTSSLAARRAGRCTSASVPCWRTLCSEPWLQLLVHALLLSCQPAWTGVAGVWAAGRGLQVCQATGQEHEASCALCSSESWQWRLGLISCLPVFCEQVCACSTLQLQALANQTSDNHFGSLVCCSKKLQISAATQLTASLNRLHSTVCNVRLCSAPSKRR